MQQQLTAFSPQSLGVLNKKVFLEISQNSQENTCARGAARVFFLLKFRPATLLKKRLWHRCFPMNFAKFLRTSFLQNTSGRLYISNVGRCPGYILVSAKYLLKVNFFVTLLLWYFIVNFKQMFPKRLLSFCLTFYLFRF